MNEALSIDQARRMFQAFMGDPGVRFQVWLRRKRAEQIRQLLTNPNAVSLDLFNREVWSLGRAQLDGRDVRGTIIDDEPPSAERAAELRELVESGRITLRGNLVWRPTTGIFFPKLRDPEQKLQNIREAIRILNDRSRSPAEQARDIEKIKGFGPNLATGLTMLFHPDEYALYNKQSQGALARLGYPVSTVTDFEQSVASLKDELGAEDYLELDAFLYRLNTAPNSHDAWTVLPGSEPAAVRSTWIFQANPQKYDLVAALQLVLAARRWRRGDVRVGCDFNLDPTGRQAEPGHNEPVVGTSRISEDSVSKGSRRNCSGRSVNDG
jgi:hypothetical protein